MEYIETYYNIVSLQITSNQFKQIEMFAEDQYYQDKALKDADNTAQRVHDKKYQPSKIKQFLRKIDEEHNSEDEGIQDYNIGGYHPVHIGEVLINRYVIVQKLGWGHFSTVWLCKDFKYNTYVAVKIQKSSPHYMEAALDEVEILQKIQMHYNDPQWEGKTRDDTHVVGLLNAFIHKTCYGNHFCMVFEILRCNLLDVLKRYNYEGIPLDICQQISRQVLKGLDYLHRICGIIHTDLKPQNVMLCLNDQQVREIIENGQLNNNQIFAERTKLIQSFMGINMEQNTKEIETEKINELENKLNTQNLTKNQKKNLKKRIRREKQKQNINQAEQESIKIKEIPKTLDELFDVKKGKLQLNRGGKLSLPLKVKIADLGNACWKHHFFSSQIQTRQYRSPQIILGQSYNETADIWSFGCMMYQMLTGDLLFQPRKTEEWGKNDDHLAQMQQLLGNFNPNFIARSQKMRKYFTKNYKMKKFPLLNHYSLQTVLQLKNKINAKSSKQFSEFLLPTLVPEPEYRISAKKALQLPWLSPTNLVPPNTQNKMSQKQHELLKKQFYGNQQNFRSEQLSNREDDASCEDNQMQQNKPDEYKSSRLLPIARKKYKVCDIRLVDRSFTDLGYVGYCQGIDVDKLDTCKNWQFQ